MKYISQAKTRGCIFCNAHRHARDDVWFVVMRSRFCFVMLNIFPYNNGHLMVVPNRHVAVPDKLRDEELLDINKTVVSAIGLLKKVLKPKGFNVGMNIGEVSGAGIAGHLHTHIVPRWPADTNFMPVVAGTKIISQSLKELYTRLRRARLANK
jgi:ATP adenylyltransferase